MACIPLNPDNDQRLFLPRVENGTKSDQTSEQAKSEGNENTGHQQLSNSRSAVTLLGIDSSKERCTIQGEDIYPR